MRGWCRDQVDEVLPPGAGAGKELVRLGPSPTPRADRAFALSKAEQARRVRASLSEPHSTLNRGLPDPCQRHTRRTYFDGGCDPSHLRARLPAMRSLPDALHNTDSPRGALRRSIMCPSPIAAIVFLPPGSALLQPISERSSPKPLRGRGCEVAEARASHVLRLTGAFGGAECGLRDGGHVPPLHQPRG